MKRNNSKNIYYNCKKIIQSSKSTINSISKSINELNQLIYNSKENIITSHESGDLIYLIVNKINNYDENLASEICSLCVTLFLKPRVFLQNCNLSKITLYFINMTKKISMYKNEPLSVINQLLFTFGSKIVSV